jgi:hypothetical protein
MPCPTSNIFVISSRKEIVYFITNKYNAVSLLTRKAGRRRHGWHLDVDDSWALFVGGCLLGVATISLLRADDETMGTFVLPFVLLPAFAS